MILLFLLRSQSIPPLPKNLAHCPVVLVWVPLVHQCSMALTENHKCIHWSSDVVLLPLKEYAKCEEVTLHYKTVKIFEVS